MINYMKKNAKIYVAGHKGLVGSSIVRLLNKLGYSNILTKSHDELNLENQAAVNSFFKQEKPEFVFLAAAKVGGIVANNTYPADFGYQNQAIGLNVIHAAYKNNVKRLMFLGSSCLFPRECPQPMKEEHLLTGPLEPTNKAYALAKIAGISLCESYNKQYGTQYMVAMPTNLYGPNDNYDLNASHVIPALMRKIHEAKISGSKSVEVWGSGVALREFMHSDDLADALVFLFNLPEKDYQSLLDSKVSGPVVNIGYGKDISIKELVELLQNIIGFSGTINWDTSKPDGTPKKLLCCNKIHSVGWKAKREFKQELSKIYNDKFLSAMALEA